MSQKLAAFSTVANNAISNYTEDNYLKESGINDIEKEKARKAKFEADIAKAKAAKVMLDDFSIHCVFPRAYLNVPFDEVHAVDKAASTEDDDYVDHCFSFYPKGNLQGYDAYANWHSLMKLKTADNSVHLGKRGRGKNYIIPMQDIIVFHPATNEDGDDGQVLIPLSAGLPYKLVRNDIQVLNRAGNVGFIIHVHQINTQ